MQEATTLRPAGPDDQTFLYDVYASTRQEELAQTQWTDAQKEEFLRMQFNAQHDYYHEHYPDAQYSVIVAGSDPIGRLYVDRREDEVRIVDIALLPAHRGNGIGGALLSELMAEATAANKPIQIHVEKFNPALKLYKRLGFVETGDTEVYLLMKWTPGTTPADEGTNR